MSEMWFEKIACLNSTFLLKTQIQILFGAMIQNLARVAMSRDGVAMKSRWSIYNTLIAIPHRLFG
jgi:hypothetical protein